MSHRPDHLRNMLHILVRRDTTLHQRLYEATKEFSAAWLHRKEWPEDLLHRAQQISKTLTANGKPIDTIVGMDTPAAADLAQKLADFVVAIEAVKARRTESRAHRAIPRSKQRPMAGAPRQPFASG